MKKPVDITGLSHTELDKMTKAQPQSQMIGEFVDWLNVEKRIYLTKYIEEKTSEGKYKKFYLRYGVPSMEKLLAEFFKIDLKKVEEERCEILEQIRSHNAV